ncbi:uncharacterized protein LOC110914454 [Helianthus annuus]|uniref:uncharacterized protein LOC110914454 n=1 Tax=Helianthus annuus TaxID=4232 RepID=UPI000B8FC5D9|nr:uncharacterized protein LOC110914454 [Helianthus annuus]
MVVAKIMCAGYYWPGMHLDAVEILRKCTSCQCHAPKILRPKNPLVLVTASWPFKQWGIDLVGPFPDAPGAVKFIIVFVDYFTKWVEAKALASTTAMVIRKFIWEHIVCWFRLPLRIITDNGTNFVLEDLQKWMKEMRIEHSFASVAHPQANGQVGNVNKQIVDGIKVRNATIPKYSNKEPKPSIQTSSNPLNSNEHNNKRSREEFELSEDEIVGDPTLRKPINDYPANIREEVRRWYIAKGACQPKGHVFAKTKVCGFMRKFQETWFDKFCWLEYSVSKDAAFCLWCYLFPAGNKFGDDVYINHGFNNWKKACEIFS